MYQTKRNIVLLLLALAVLTGALGATDAQALPAAYADMDDYCIIPPYVKTDIEPNIMIMMDNFNVTGIQAYGDLKDFKTFQYIGWNVAANDIAYEGNYKSAIRYSYMNNRFDPDNGGDPATCPGSGKRAGANTDPNDPDGDCLPGIFDGNMLSWAATSRYDLIMSILLGGRGTPRYYANTLWGINLKNEYPGNPLKPSLDPRPGWPEKNYAYKGLDPVTGMEKNYLCSIFVNENSNGDIIFRDYWRDVNGNGTVEAGEVYPCGLLEGIGPVDASSYAKMASLDQIGDAIMLAERKAPAEVPVLPVLENAESVQVAAATVMPGMFSSTVDRVLSILTPQEVLAAPKGGGGGPPLTINNPRSNDVLTFKVDATTRIAIVNIPYDATGGTIPYNWPKPSTSPAMANVSIVQDATGNSYLYGKVHEGECDADFTFDVTQTVTDTPIAPPTGSASVFYKIFIDNSVGPPEPIREARFLDRTCAGDYTANCNKNPSGENLKEGILLSFWDQANFGLSNFDSKQDPSLPYCIEESLGSTELSESFANEVQNSVPVGTLLTPTKLIDGEYKTVQAFYNESGGTDKCKIIDNTNTKPCTNNFILMLSSGEGAATGTQTFATTPAACSTLTDLLTKNACWAYNTDLSKDKEGKQNVSTYVVNAMGINAAMNKILKDTALHGGGNYYMVENPATLRQTLEQAFKDIIRRAASGTAASVLASGEGSGANLIQAVYYPKKRFRNSATEAFDEISWIGKMTNYWYYVDPFFRFNNIREDTLRTDPPVLNGTSDKIVELYYDSKAASVKARRAIPNADGSPAVYDAVDVGFEETNPIWEAGEMLWNRDLAADPRTIYFPQFTGSNYWEQWDPTKWKMGAFTNSTGNINSKWLARMLNVAKITMNWSTWTTTVTFNPADVNDVIQYVNGYDFPEKGYRSRTIKIDQDGDGETSNSSTTPDETVGRVWKLGDVLNSTPRIVSTGALNSYADRYNDRSYYLFTNAAAYQSRGMVFAGANDGMLHAFNLGIYNTSWPGQTFDEKARLTKQFPGDVLGREEWAFIPLSALPYLRYMMESSYCHIYSVDMNPNIVEASIAVDPIPNESLVNDWNSKWICSGDKWDYWNCLRGEDSWRTILISGMRYGGACLPRNYHPDSMYAQQYDWHYCYAESQGIDLNLDGVSNYNDCIYTPLEDPSWDWYEVGMSSYFALDITDPRKPKYLWEKNMWGSFATTDAATVKVAPPVKAADGTDTPDLVRNGRWFAVFGQGPTGAIDKVNDAFTAGSDEYLRYMAIDLKSGDEYSFYVYDKYGNPIRQSFAGTMYGTSLDANNDYSDDVLYVGYTRKCDPARAKEVKCEYLGEDGTVKKPWNDGGVVRILTNNDLYPYNWKARTLIDGIGPVTSAPRPYRVYKEDLDEYQMWIYFGTGRYYYVTSVTDTTGEKVSSPDDPFVRRGIYAVRDLCYKNLSGSYSDASCTSMQTRAALTDVTATPLGAATVPTNGWYLDLDLADKTTGFAAERIITDVMPSPSTGILFATSFKPYTDVCSIGGKSHVWSISLTDGGCPCGQLKGTALMQVSTGSIEKMNLETAFGCCYYAAVAAGGTVPAGTEWDPHNDPRKTKALEGVPPIAQGFSVFVPPAPEPRVLRMIERGY